MTRTSTEWRGSAIENIDDVTADLIVTTDEIAQNTKSDADELGSLLLSEELHLRDRRLAVMMVERALVERAHDLLDQAYAVRKLRSGPTLRNLDGKEPVGYSKRDCGVAHDALYGARSQGASAARELYWPLNLSEWEHERVNRDPRTDDPVTAEGIEKYKTTVSGRRAELVLGEVPPPI